MSLQRVFPARLASCVEVTRRWRIPWRFLTKLFGLLAALFGLLRVILELWAMAR